jgi:hypothetical protein
MIGKEKKTVVVHANAIAATCNQMTVLINGNMNEASTRCAEIGNVEVEDFVRFCEYAYSGDFTVPTWKQDETPNAHEPVVDLTWPGEPVDEVPRPDVSIGEEIPEPLEDWAFRPEDILKKKKSKAKRLASNLREIFVNRTYQADGDNARSEIQGRFKPYANDTANQDFTPVFLAYARLYTFAHFRAIEPLKALTLQKLHSTLKGFKLYHKRVGDIVKLAEYAYTTDDLPGRGNNGTIDLLRQLVVEYIVCEINTIGMCREFVEFMEDGGEFVGDFWRTMRLYNTFA